MLLPPSKAHSSAGLASTDNSTPSGSLSRTPSASPSQRSPSIRIDASAKVGSSEAPLRRHSRRIASTLLEHLLPEAERAQECSELDMEAPAGAPASDGFTSYKSFAQGPQRFRLCVRRARNIPDGRFRVLDRNAAFGQSKGHWAIKNVAIRRDEEPPSASRSRLTKSLLDNLLLEDTYHAILDAKFSSQLLVFAAVYLLSFSGFALCYLAMADDCGLKLEHSFRHAYMLSLETMLTIGYGVSDPYMHGCWEAPIVLTVQSLLNLLISACLIGVIFQGLSRPQSRASTILFSEKAVIRRIGDAHCLAFRVCDLRVQHALIEPHVRCYCVQMGDKGPELTPLRLEQPSDELGAPLLMTLPSLVVHRIDASSPLAPVGLRSSAPREADCLCPTCGEAFPTARRLRLHCEYLAASDAAAGLPVARRHRELGAGELKVAASRCPSAEEIRQHLTQEFVEVIALVEGIEPTTAATLQARHSYVVGGQGEHDFEWDMDFAQCCRLRRDGTPGIALDMSNFHELEPLGTGALQEVPVVPEDSPQNDGASESALDASPQSAADTHAPEASPTGTYLHSPEE